MTTIREHLDAAWRELDDPAAVGAIDRASNHIDSALAILNTCDSQTESSFRDPIGAPVRVIRVPDGTRPLTVPS